MTKTLQERLLYSTLSMIIAIMGFIGVRLWGQIDTNTSAIAVHTATDAAMLEQLKAINNTLEDVKDVLKELSKHEQTHRTGR